MKSFLKLRVLPTLLIIAYWLLNKLIRLESINKPKESEGNALYAHWHGDELLMMAIYLKHPMAILVSNSEDGEILNRFLSFFKYTICRGSSTRGGVSGYLALKEAVLRGNDASLAVDGPRGPIYKVKDGIIKLAQETGLPIVMGACSAKYAFRFKKAWNKCYLPLPFSRCVIYYGKPMRIDRDLDKMQRELKRVELENTLQKLKRQSDSHFAKVRLTFAQKSLETS